MLDRYRVSPGTPLDLAGFSPDDTGDFDGGKRAGRKHLKDLRRQLAELQRLLWADGRRSVLVVIQAMDTGGKDGAIRKVFEGVNPQGVRVANFKAPTERELAHDYLWRVHQQAPRDGEIAVFNRSHYEDVLVVRVLGLAPEEVWRKRYDHIADFERMLVDEGTTIVKFYLNISKEEQAERLQARLDDPTKRWKFNAGDLDHRELWHDYMAAFAEAISRTTTADAPWYVVPANKKWYRDIVIATTLVETLRNLELSYPEADEGLDDTVIT
ncbi:MAG TPA: polyphosphate kinase 2 family protein [Acidimicrobiia bacterium]|nr:polyphosphate kinase 2 family protein [Acidimicrobiia bacterium]